MLILKRPFFLIEIFIAIALLTMCAFPLIHSSVTTFKDRKEKLFQLELARQAELLYYQFLKESVSSILFEDIPYYNTSCTKKSPPKTPLPSLLVLGETFYPHYHLYHTHTKKEKIDKYGIVAHYQLCISQKKECCDGYKPSFHFFAKKVDENVGNQHFDKKEEPVRVDHERLSSELQTLHSGERKTP